MMSTTEDSIFDLVESIQGNRLSLQRSHIAPKNPQSARINPSSQATAVKPLQDACEFYCETLPCVAGQATTPISTQDAPGADCAGLVVAQAGWVPETRPVDGAGRPMVNTLASESGVDDLDTTFQYEQVDPYINFYREHFFGQDHTNFVGVCDTAGPTIVSLRREYDANSTQYAYRAIIRSANGGSRRVVIKEACVPRKNDSATVVEVIERILPEAASARCLSHAKVDRKMAQQLQGLDGCLGNADKTYKIGVLCIEANQMTEEDVYGNRASSPLFQEFLDILADRVDLQGFTGFRGGLDVRDNHTGTQSYYTQENGCQCMFHVVTMLPFTEKDEQQVQRKRHIGNNCVTIVYMAPDAPPFDPSKFVSNFQLVFLVVRRLGSASDPPSYRVATVRMKDVAEFGPDFPDTGDVFAPGSVANGTLRRFLLAKAISAENATYTCERIYKILNRTRLRLLDAIVDTYHTDIPLVKQQPTSSLSRIKALLSSRKRRGFSLDTTVYGQDAQVWWLQLVAGSAVENAAVVVSNDLFVTIDSATQSTRNQFPASSVAGWHCHCLDHGLTVIYGKGNGILTLECRNAANRDSLIRRLKANNAGAPLNEIKLCRVDKGQIWGFETKGMVVIDIVDGGIACNAGLELGDKIYLVNDHLIEGMAGERVESLLGNTPNVLRVYTLPKEVAATEPDQAEPEDGARRKLFDGACHGSDVDAPTSPAQPEPAVAATPEVVTSPKITVLDKNTAEGSYGLEPLSESEA